MRYSPTHDHVVAIVLPFMNQKHETVIDAALDFTVNDAKQMYLDGLPVFMNHNDGQIDDETGKKRYLDEVGRVQAMNIHGVEAKVLLSIDPSRSEAAKYCSNAVAKGIYKGVSLGNRVSTKIRATDGTTYFVKTPTEVSLCETGRRYGSEITSFLPCRSTIERLHKNAPEDLVTLSSLHGYEKDLIAKGVTPSDGQKYIDAFVELSNERLNQIIDKENLYPSNPKMTSTADSSDQTISTEIQQASESAAPATETTTSETVATPAAVAQQTNEVMTPVPESPDVRDAKMMSALAIQLKEKNVELMKEVAEGRKAKEELDQIIAKKKAEQAEKFKTIIQSYKQHAQKAEIPEDEINSNIELTTESFDINQEKGIQSAKNALHASVRAAKQFEQQSNNAVKRMAEDANNKTSQYFDDASARFTELNSIGRSFSIDTNSSAPAAKSIERSALTSLDMRFKTDTPASEVVKQEAMPPPNQSSAVKRPYVEKPAPELFVRASSGEKNDYAAADEFIKQCEYRGRCPTMKEIEFGVNLEATGEMKASKNGNVPVMRMVKRRKLAAAIEPANFAPEFDELLQRAVLERDNRDIRVLDRVKLTMGNTVQLDQI